MKQITDHLNRQHFEQTPVYLPEQSRLSGNLIGIGLKGLSDELLLTCESASAQYLVLDKGFYAGLYKGAVLQNSVSGKIIEVDSVNTVQCFAAGNGTTALKGEVFRLLDKNSPPKPIVKLYLPEARFAEAEFNAFVKNKIKPLAATGNYADY